MADPNFNHTLEANKQNVFDVSKLIKRRMKPKPIEQYTHFNISVDEESAEISEDEDILNYDDIDDPEAFA